MGLARTDNVTLAPLCHPFASLVAGKADVTFTRLIMTLVAAALLAGCNGVPEGLHPVGGFDVARYLGRWHEIARLDHRFERGLTNVSAEYSRLLGGDIQVVNRGFDTEANSWRELQGIVRLSGRTDVGSLRVSFFRPFWFEYHVIALDVHDYQYAMVAGPSRDYLWILSRKPTLDPELLSALVDQAKTWGFDTDRLVFVEHRPVKSS